MYKKLDRVGGAIIIIWVLAIFGLLIIPSNNRKALESDMKTNAHHRTMFCEQKQKMFRQYKNIPDHLRFEYTLFLTECEAKYHD